MSSRIAFVAVLSVLLSGLGCVNVNTRIPDVNIERGGSSDGGSVSTSDPKTPYAKELDKVLQRQGDVEKELAKRKWEGVDEKLGDWSKDTRKLMGKANTSRNPARMREYCERLMSSIQSMQDASARRDFNGVRKGMDAANPWLNKLSAEFPMTESAAAAPPPPSSTARPAPAKSTPAVP